MVRPPAQVPNPSTPQPNGDESLRQGRVWASQKGTQGVTEENSRLDCPESDTCDRVQTSQTTSMKMRPLGALRPLSGCYQEERDCWCDRRDPGPCLELLRLEPEWEERLWFPDWPPLRDWPDFFRFLVFDLLLCLAWLPGPRRPLLVF